MNADAMPDWQDLPRISRAEFYAMSDEEQKLIEFDPNKWQFEWESACYFNAHHPDNDEWLQMRQATEAAALLG